MSLGADWVRGAGRVLTLKGFSSMVLSQRTQLPQASVEEVGGHAPAWGRGNVRFRNGDEGLALEEFKPQPSTLDNIISPHLPPNRCVGLGDAQPILADSSPGPYPVASKQIHGPDHSQEGRALTDIYAGRVTEGLTCPQEAQRKHPHLTSAPGARTSVAIQTFSFIDTGFEAQL